MSRLLARSKFTHGDAESSFPGWQNPIQPYGAEDHGEGYDLLGGVQSKAVRTMNA